MLNHRFARLALAITALAAAFTAEMPASFAGSPLGYQLMCLKTPAECRGGGATKIKGTDDQMKTLRRVNTSVNKAIRPRNDAGADVWNASATSGDCEDYALAKRRALIKAGFSPSSLRLAYVKTRRGEDHAVLVVKTARGDMVLDNLSSKVKPLSQSGLRVISMAGADPMKWS
jgi:predicted transglutaminase-like cysteine proteinase